MKMQGYGVSKGLCYAKILVVDEEPIVFPTKSGCPEEEEIKFRNAHTAVLAETVSLREKAGRTAGKNAADIIDVHCSLLEDDGLIQPILSEIERGTGAAMAVEQVMSGLIQQFEAMENPYFAQRALDIKDIKQNLVYAILNRKRADISSLSEPVIIAGRDITPSQTAAMDRRMVAGLLMESGGATSHTAILAKTLDIPAIVGVKGLLEKIKTGDMAGLDGETGEVFTDLTENEVAGLKKKTEEETKEKERINRLAGKKAVTSDGKSYEICGNIGTPEDVCQVLQKGGEGIGLFRSEFLYLSAAGLPDEETQLHAYQSVLQRMGEKPVVVRTLDIGGDKEVPSLGLKKEANPFLGLRAIRLCEKEQEVFRTQLRALLRASVYGNLKVMFPMISSMEELQFAKAQVKVCMEELAEKNIPFQEHIPLGMMVEIPAVAVMAEVFAGECDFFSIGTNDLTQYTLAVDRGNESVAERYSYYHPAVLKLMKAAIDGAHKNHILCGMCGEAAGDLNMIPVLIGMGLDEYSMAAASIPEAKDWIGKLDTVSCKQLADRVLSLKTASEVEQELKAYRRKGENKC